MLGGQGRGVNAPGALSRLHHGRPTGPGPLRGLHSRAMSLLSLIAARSEEILRESAASMERAHLPGYAAAGKEATEERLRTLLDLVRLSLAENDLSHVTRHAETVARQRWESGVDLSEVQTAYNVLEESIWRRVVAEAPPADLAKDLGLVATVLGAGKDVLARTWVSLAAKTRVESLDLTSLFKGTGAA